MKRSKIISYSTVLLASALVFGCSTADRVEEVATSITNPNDKNASNVNQSDLNQVDKEVQIVKENNPTIINPNENNSTANTADTRYLSELATTKEVISTNETAVINFNIKNIFSGELADINYLKEVKLTVDPKYLQFIQEKGEPGTVATLKNATGSVAIQSLKKSATTYIKLQAEFAYPDEDGNIGGSKYITSYLPLAIIKNNSSTMTIIPNYSPSKQKYDQDLGLYIDTFTIHVVDKYGNKAKDGTKVHVGVVNNLKKDATTNLPLYSSPILNTPANNMGTLDNTNQATTFTSGKNLSNVKYEDTVVIMANEEKSNPLYLGGWGINRINGNTIDIWNDYTTENPASTQNLTYAVGNDKKVNRCEETLATASVYATDKYTDYLVKDGLVEVELRYDPYMVGKTVFIYANSTLEDKRIGVSRRVDLYGVGPQDFPFSVENDTNQTITRTYSHILRLKDSKHVIQDSRFSSIIFSSKPCGVRILNKIACDGVQEVNVTLGAGEKCTFSMGDFKPEFE